MFPATATRVCPDLASWADWVDELSGVGRAHLVVDAAVAGSEIDSTMTEVLDRHGVRTRRRVVGPRTGLADVLADTRGVREGDLVIAHGGGGVMDRAKLLALLAGDDSAAKRLTATQRCGMIMVPPGVRRRVPLALVPTTLGTGSEMSRSACIEAGGRKRLAFGEALRADCAVHTADATDSLPAELVAEGVLEALFRLTAVYVGSLGDLPEQDALVERDAVRLVRLGDEVRAARDARRPVAPEVRVAAAGISGASHTDEVVTGRDAYCDIAWPLANELSMATDSRKLTALAVVTPVVWRRMSAGDEQFGSARRLGRLWDLLRDAARAGLGPVPAAGLGTLIDHWGIDRGLDAARADADALAGHAVQAWGRGLPMLRRLSVAEIASVYTDALAATDERPRRHHGKEVGQR